MTRSIFQARMSVYQRPLNSRLLGVRDALILSPG